MSMSLQSRAIVLSIALFFAFAGLWQLILPAGTGSAADMDPAYAALMGATAKGASAMPGPLEVGKQIWEHVLDPFYDAGPNDKGIGIQLGYSILRVLVGFGFAVMVAIPLGFLIGMSPLFYKALDPFIQIMKPVSPLAWMPLALYTIKDSIISSVFVIFICSVWPMLTNTAFGVASVRKEWLNVAKTLEVGHLRTAFRVILPAAIGYFVWNEWNNLSITNVIAAIFFIGLIGMVLDLMLSYLARLVTYTE